MSQGIYSKLAVDGLELADKNLQSLHNNIREYCDSHHNFSFNPENPVVRLHEPTFGADEIIAAVDVLLSTRVTMGPKVLAFENQFSKLHHHNHGVTSNSGSSANLLAIAALSNPAIADGFRPGDEVIVPALSWSTTVWPLIQHNLIPVIVDIDPLTFNIDPSQIERAIGPKTRGIMPVHVYGNPCDMSAITTICKKHNLILVEDCCEALGAKYNHTEVGRFGRVGTFSFYFSHHITMLEGGITVTDDFELSELMRVLRAHGWTRELEDKQQYVDKFSDFDPRFLFVNLGYNLRITELQAAMGLEQLPKLADFVAKRRENSLAWKDELSQYADFFDFQHDTKNAESSYFGFPLILKKNGPISLPKISKFLNNAGIETRPIICGNISKQPAMKMYQHRIVGDLANSNHIMENGFSFGNHQAIGQEARSYVNSNIDRFLKSI
jgi:CDP-6-deoxy-D-xylo-4-hexulose-3-dehydrase